MIINGKTLLEMAPIKDMFSEKIKAYGVSHGLGEAGYDIRLKQDVCFEPDLGAKGMIFIGGSEDHTSSHNGRFVIASAMEQFQMPSVLTGIVHDKSTWARQGLSVFNTVIEPGFIGGLTLELVYHGSKRLEIPAGAGIAQVIFHRVVCPAEYDGKYQNQSTEPVDSKWDDLPIWPINVDWLSDMKEKPEKLSQNVLKTETKLEKG